MNDLTAIKPVKMATVHDADTASVKANNVGLVARDYEDKITALADLQRDMDVHEAASGNRHPDAHHAHEKMVSAANNLKHIIQTTLAEENCQSYPDFNLKTEKTSAASPDKVRLTLRIEGVMDRKQAVPIMGALVRAFNRKRKSSFGGSHEDMHDELHMGDDGLHFSLDIPHNLVEGFLDDLSKPLLTISGLTTTHMGAVKELSKMPQMSN